MMFGTQFTRGKKSIERLIRILAVASMALSLLAFPGPGSAQSPASSGIVELEDLHAGLPDLDTRTQIVSPTTQQINAVAALGAHASWTQFGTPQSLIKFDGTDLATGLSGNAATASRAWLRANSSLFRLSQTSVDNLELVNDTVLPETTAHVVLFRQHFGNLTAAQDGMITIGFVNGNISYVSSSSAGDAAAPGAAILTPVQAWLAAATNVGHGVSLSAVSGIALDRDWTVFNVAGFAQPQRARLRALPIPGNGVRPVYEVDVIQSNGKDVFAYLEFVDAQKGQVLFRQNAVDNFDQGAQVTAPQQVTQPGAPQASAPTNFTGTFAPPPAAACGMNGPYTAPAGTPSITVVANADIPENDILLNLLFGPVTVVASSDEATSPEAVTYSPAGGVPAGNYFVQVCPSPAPAGPFIAPYTYRGAITMEAPNTAPPAQTHAQWKYFLTHPPLDYSNTDTRAVGCWQLVSPSSTPADCTFLLNNRAAAVPWDYDVQAGASTHTTTGNSANSARSWGSPLTPSEQYRPVSASRAYTYTWTNQWYTSKCNPTAFTSPQQIDSDAAVTNLTSEHNRMHDWAYGLGFTERTYNAQQYNFGTNENGQNDAETGNTMAGAASGGAAGMYLGRDNANQITLQDGVIPITNMYLWQPIAGAFYASCTDGDYDMSVVGHEYTHLISNRMVGGPDASLTGQQAGSMGESWSDLDAIEYLQGLNYESISNPAGYVVGAYVTGNKVTGIRNYVNDTAAHNPLNYSDLGYDVGGPEVHSDAEIWDAANHDIRRALMAKYNGAFPYTDKIQQKKCAQGSEPAYHCPGNRRWIRTVYAAWLLMQPGVSMLDARDAYLAADNLLHAGYGNHQTCGGFCWPSNQAELWNAFATRGMGKNASSAGTADVDAKSNFESPLQPNPATVTFTPVADEESSIPIVGKIYVGPYEKGAVPIADTDPSTPSVTNVAKFVPGTYSFVFQAAGYGLRRFSLTLTAGQNLTLPFRVSTNWASQSKGGTITALPLTPASASGDANVGALIDDTENTLWTRTITPTGTITTTDGAQVIVKLGGTGAHTVQRVQVSALLNAGGRFTALRQFEILGCTVAGANLCTQAGNFTHIYTSSLDAFPGAQPRPAQPNLLLRSFTVPATSVTHIMLRALHNQCTGNTQFQGDQDNDPTNNSDCMTSSSSPTGKPAAQTLRATELEVFDRTTP